MLADTLRIARATPMRAFDDLIEDAIPLETFTWKRTRVVLTAPSENMGQRNVDFWSYGFKREYGPMAVSFVGEDPYQVQSFMNDLYDHDIWVDSIEGTYSSRPNFPLPRDVALEISHGRNLMPLFCQHLHMSNNWSSRSVKMENMIIWWNRNEWQPGRLPPFLHGLHRPKLKSSTIRLFGNEPMLQDDEDEVCYLMDHLDEALR